MPVIVIITGTDCQPHELMSSASDDESPAAVERGGGDRAGQWQCQGPVGRSRRRRSHWHSHTAIGSGSSEQISLEHLAGPLPTLGLSSGQPGRASGGGLWGLRLGSNTGEPVTLFIWRRVLSTLLSGQPGAGSVEGGVTGHRFPKFRTDFYSAHAD